MSQASDLLNGLSGDDVVTPIDVANEHIVVGADRFIRVPDSLMRLGVQHDKDIETVTFDCPRHWGKHDLSSMQIYINYVLPNGEDGRCPVSNLSTIGTKMYFDWTISDYVTQYNGKISFLICAVTVDAEGNEALHWNSELNQECYISEGLECRESTIHKYPDIVTHLLTRMKEVEAIATPEAMQAYTDTWLEANRDRILAEIEAKGAATLDTIPADYTETNRMANESVRTKADAIVCSAQGEVIAVTDSSDDHIRNLRVFGKTAQVATTGKNLFDVATALSNQKRGTTDVSDYVAYRNGVKVTTNSRDHGRAYIHLQLEAGTYTISANIHAPDAWNFSVKNYDTNIELVNFTTARVNGQVNHTFTLDTAALVGFCFMSVISNGSATTATDIQLELGSKVTAYEPYSGGFASPSPNHPQDLETIELSKVSVIGKNLLDMTVNEHYIDGEVRIPYSGYNGIEARGFNKIRVYPGRIYTFSYDIVIGGDRIVVSLMDADGFILGDVDIGWGSYLPFYDGRYGAVGPGATFTIPADSQVAFMRIHLCQMNESGEGNYNVYRNLQLEEGPAVTEYEPYKETKISTSHILNGIPVTSGGNYTDTNGQQWICDEIDFERGVYIRRIGEVVIDGTVAPTVFSPGTNGGSAFGFNYSYIGIDDILRDRCPKLCDRLLPMPDATIASWKLCEIGYWGFNTDGSADNFLIMNVGEFESAEAAQTWLTSNHVTFQYILRAPIETPLTVEELEAFKALKTNYRHTTVLNDAGAHMELVYNVDTKTYVDNGIKKSVTDVLEAIENGSY